jgi:hypothetical protein
MEEQLDTLNHEFTVVKENIHSVNTNIASIKTKLDKLRCVYSKMISTNSHKKIFLFCLESFNFQIKSFSVDSDNLHKCLMLVSNRVYCDYYKLFKLIKTLFDDYGYNFPKQISKTHTYDILNPFFEYSVADIDKIHGDVCALINALIEYYNYNCSKIANYTSKSQTGISIFNFIKTLEYDNSVLKDQIVLYLNYMDFFKITQTKYLAKLVGKTDLLKKEIDDEIVDDLDPVSGAKELVTPVVLTIDASNPPNTPVVMTIDQTVTLTIDPSNPPNTPVVLSEDEDEDGPYLELTSSTRGNTVISDVLSEISELSLSDSQVSKGSSTEKKNEKMVQKNVEEKTVKKKGRPRTKNVAKTKNDKKDEVTDTEGRSAPDTESSAHESFGLTIDQIEEHVNSTI